ncbi:hypothetical protein EW146_g8022 [Bondarzewia mesenterica]|uniref:APC amino acid permease n=1 Tax=Bondarzewia mesenterica TaxID=1095465 RepID=A0A4S4LJI0_9AGAM|nr:hypothetical protein EW146_g8022 [Bondarzewia mesenterica]
MPYTPLILRRHGQNLSDRSGPAYVARKSAHAHAYAILPPDWCDEWKSPNQAGRRAISGLSRLPANGAILRHHMDSLQIIGLTAVVKACATSPVNVSAEVRPGFVEDFASHIPDIVFKPGRLTSTSDEILRRETFHLWFYAVYQTGDSVSASTSTSLDWISDIFMVDFHGVSLKIAWRSQVTDRDSEAHRLFMFIVTIYCISTCPSAGSVRSSMLHVAPSPPRVCGRKTVRGSRVSICLFNSSQTSSSAENMDGLPAPFKKTKSSFDSKFEIPDCADLLPAAFRRILSSGNRSNEHRQQIRAESPPPFSTHSTDYTGLAAAEVTTVDDIAYPSSLPCAWSQSFSFRRRALDTPAPSPLRAVAFATCRGLPMTNKLSVCWDDSSTHPSGLRHMNLRDPALSTSCVQAHATIMLPACRASRTRTTENQRSVFLPLPAIAGNSKRSRLLGDTKRAPPYAGNGVACRRRGEGGRQAPRAHTSFAVIHPLADPDRQIIAVLLRVRVISDHEGSRATNIIRQPPSQGANTYTSPIPPPSSPLVLFLLDAQVNYHLRRGRLNTAQRKQSELRPASSIHRPKTTGATGIERSFASRMRLHAIKPAPTLIDLRLAPHRSPHRRYITKFFDSSVREAILIGKRREGTRIRDEMLTPEALETKLRAGLPIARLEIVDESDGCGENYSVLIVSEGVGDGQAFEGKTTLARHRLVNELLKVEIAQIHAFTQCYFINASRALVGSPPPPRASSSSSSPSLPKSWPANMLSPMLFAIDRNPIARGTPESDPESRVAYHDLSSTADKSLIGCGRARQASYVPVSPKIRPSQLPKRRLLGFYPAPCARAIRSSPFVIIYLPLMPVIQKPVTPHLPHSSLRSRAQRKQPIMSSSIVEEHILPTVPQQKTDVELADENLLATLGYKQEFQRAFTPLEVRPLSLSSPRPLTADVLPFEKVFGIAFSIIGLLPSIASVLFYSVPNGGPAAMVWGWAVASIFILLVGMSMAELASAAPTSGGLYFWTHSLSAPRWRNLLAWIVGYANTIGSIASVASIDWGASVQVMAAASIGSDNTFTATSGQLYGVFAAIVLSHAVICCLGTRILARLQSFYVILNVLLCLAIIVALPAATPKELRNTAKFAFGDFTNMYDWPNGYAFILSFMAPLWTICSFDSSVHISEEASNAATAVPYAIIWAIGIAGLLGWAINVSLAFCMGTDLEAIMAAPQPMAQILFNSFGKSGTLAVWAFIVMVQYMMGSSMVLAASRQSYAFARDGALPFSPILYRMNAYTHTPVNTVWFVAIFSLLLGLLVFAGQQAINAVFAISVTALYIAYAIPIAARAIWRKENGWTPGAFSLGIWSLPVATIAVLFMLFMSIVFLFPTTRATSTPDMNYTVVVLGGVLILSIVWYYFPKYGGVHWFTGPISNIDGYEEGKWASGQQKSAEDVESEKKDTVKESIVPVDS